MRLVVFDLDGTLIDSHAYIGATAAQAFVEEGLPPPDPEASRRVLGLGLPQAMAELSRLDGEALQALVSRFRTVFHASPPDEAREPLFPGAREVVEALHAAPETLLGIATGKGMRGVERVLALHSMRRFFVTRQTTDDNPSKPHPGMLLRAIEKTGVSAPETAMIGDTTFDMEMAVAAGARAIGVRWGYHCADDLKSAGADLLVDRFDDLPAAIDDLVSAHA